MKLDELERLWFKFSDVPINDNDEIQQEYMCFPINTDRFEIWHWFEEQNISFSVWDKLYRGKS